MANSDKRPTIPASPQSLKALKDLQRDMTTVLSRLDSIVWSLERIEERLGTVEKTRAAG